MKLDTHEELSLQWFGYKAGYCLQGLLHLEHVPCPPAMTSTQLRSLAIAFNSIADKIDEETKEEKKRLEKRLKELTNDKAEVK